MMTMETLFLKALLGICLSSLLIVSCSLGTTLPSPSLPTSSRAPTIVVESSSVFVIPTPTSTPQLTLSPEQIQEQILSLLENNGGCRLPCWWGIKPGITGDQDALNILERLGSNIYIDNYGIAADFTTLPEGISNHYVEISLGVSNETIQRIRVAGIDKVEQYYLSQFISGYGQPDEIWINTFSPNLGEKTVLFSVIAFYGKQGIVAYWVGSGVVEGSMIQGCIESSPGLYLWSPDSNIKTITDTSNLFDPILPRGALRLTEANGMDEETFYNTFRGIDVPVCLDTPKRLWLGVYGQTPSP